MKMYEVKNDIFVMISCMYNLRCQPHLPCRPIEAGPLQLLLAAISFHTRYLESLHHDRFFKHGAAVELELPCCSNKHHQLSIPDKLPAIFLGEVPIFVG